MRDYTNIDRYLNNLAQDIYPQPEDEGHTALAYRVIDTWMSRFTACKSVLDLGCGTGFCQQFFENVWGAKYEGICLGEDFITARDAGRNVKKMDFHFLDYPDSSFDLLFARHSLEHSPMPLLALMEWHRVSTQWLGIVLPAPEWWTYKGVNHYSVMNQSQILTLLERAGWKPIWNEIDYRERDGEQIPHEYWIMSEKT